MIIESFSNTFSKCVYIYIYLPINLKRRFRNYPKPVIVVFRLSLGTQFHLLCIYLGIMVIHEFKCMSSSRDVFCLWILSGLQCEILPLTSFPGGCAYCTSMEMHWSQCAVSMQHGIQVQEKRTAFSSSYEMIEQTKWLKCYVWIAYRKNMLKSFLRSTLYHKFLKKLLGGRRFSQVFKAVVELLVPLFCMSEILVFYCLLPTILEILQLRSHFSSVTCVGQLIASKFFIHQRTHPKKNKRFQPLKHRGFHESRGRLSICLALDPLTPEVFCSLEELTLSSNDLQDLEGIQGLQKLRSGGRSFFRDVGLEGEPMEDVFLVKCAPILLVGWIRVVTTSVKMKLVNGPKDFWISNFSSDGSIVGELVYTQKQQPRLLDISCNCLSSLRGLESLRHLQAWPAWDFQTAGIHKRYPDDSLFCIFHPKTWTFLVTLPIIVIVSTIQNSLDFGVWHKDGEVEIECWSSILVFWCTPNRPIHSLWSAGPVSSHICDSKKVSTLKLGSSRFPITCPVLNISLWILMRLIFWLHDAIEYHVNVE